MRLDIALVGHRGLELAVEGDVGLGEAGRDVALGDAHVASGVSGAAGASGGGVLRTCVAPRREGVPFYLTSPSSRSIRPSRGRPMGSVEKVLQ